MRIGDMIVQATVQLAISISKVDIFAQISNVTIGGTLNGAQFAAGASGAISGALTVAMAIGGCIEGYRDIMQASVTEVVDKVMGRGASSATAGGAGVGDPIGKGYYAANTNSRTIAFAMRYPFEALAIGYCASGSTNISTNAVRFSTRIGLLENDLYEGSQVNAFRHVLWQAEITNRFGGDIASKIGNAHEENPLAAHENNLKYYFESSADADETIDLLNNVIGRKIGNENVGLSMKRLAMKALNYYYEEGFWSTAEVLNKNGEVIGYLITQYRLTQSEFESTMKIVKNLNDDGFTIEEANKRLEDAMNDSKVLEKSKL